jgi:O-antigen/teichoic acid export membrane protein
LLFGDKWVGAVIVLQVLSIGNALQLANGAAISLLQAQGRFRTIFRLTIVLAINFLCLVIIGALIGGIGGAACAATLSAMTAGFLLPYVATKPSGGTSRDAVGIYLRPAFAAAIAMGLSVLASWAIPASMTTKWAEAARLGLMGCVMLISYWSLIAVIAPALHKEFVARVRTTLWAWRA